MHFCQYVVTLFKYVVDRFQHLKNWHLSLQTPDCHSAQPMWNPGDSDQLWFKLGDYGIDIYDKKKYFWFSDILLCSISDISCYKQKISYNFLGVKINIIYIFTRQTSDRIFLRHSQLQKNGLTRLISQSGKHFRKRELLLKLDSSNQLG